MTSGIHHVTLITRDVQANVDFYVGFLGLRLVKRTGGFEDSEQLHLFYGDRIGSPGSIVSFLVWEGGMPGRVGHGQIAEIALAVPASSIGDWLSRAIASGIRVEGPSREFGETVLRLKDPDGVIVKLVGSDLPAGAAWPGGPTRLRAVTLWTEKPAETAAFIARMGYREGPAEGGVRRLLSDTDAVDIRDVSGFVEGIPGTGIIDHVAFRALDVAAVQALQAGLAQGGAVPMNYHDRKYFTSLYVREPGGTLIEVATDGPGFTVDEAEETLGETLFIPLHDEERAEALRVVLPQFALPGQERIRYRDLPFVHRIRWADEPDGSTLLLLHGSGGTETDLMPAAARINPRATLLGVRGRATEEGSFRWFRRLAPMVFDQDDVRAEAEAFAAFVDGAARGYGLDPETLTVMGHSNGANFAGAVMALFPGLIRRAILIRPVPVLDPLPAADLSSTRVLSLVGARDPYNAHAPKLNDWLCASGAELDARLVEAGHDLSAQDIDIAADWLMQA
ncbi:MAG: VOC family protein [Mesorhizobium sp.]